MNKMEGTGLNNGNPSRFSTILESNSNVSVVRTGANGMKGSVMAGDGFSLATRGTEAVYGRLSVKIVFCSVWAIIGYNSIL